MPARSEVEAHRKRMLGWPQALRLQIHDQAHEFGRGWLQEAHSKIALNSPRRTSAFHPLRALAGLPQPLLPVAAPELHPPLIGVSVEHRDFAERLAMLLSQAESRRS